MKVAEDRGDAAEPLAALLVEADGRDFRFVRRCADDVDDGAERCDAALQHLSCMSVAW